jgi:predicted DNA-binding transcriptional regulator AlpA
MNTETLTSEPGKQDLPQFITIDQFCAMLGVARMWFYRHKDDPAFPGLYHAGVSVRLDKGECLAYIASLRIEPATPPQPVEKGVTRKRHPGRPTKNPRR